MLTRKEVEGMELDAVQMNEVIHANAASAKSAGGWISVGFEEAKRQMLVHFAPVEVEEPEVVRKFPDFHGGRSQKDK